DPLRSSGAAQAGITVPLVFVEKSEEPGLDAVGSPGRRSSTRCLERRQRRHDKPAGCEDAYGSKRGPRSCLHGKSPWEPCEGKHVRRPLGTGLCHAAQCLGEPVEQHARESTDGGFLRKRLGPPASYHPWRP